MEKTYVVEVAEITRYRVRASSEDEAVKKATGKHPPHPACLPAGSVSRRVNWAVGLAPAKGEQPVE